MFEIVVSVLAGTLIAAGAFGGGLIMAVERRSVRHD